jgi:hypothetical protein
MLLAVVLLCGVTARIGLVEPATGCMVCLTVQYTQIGAHRPLAHSTGTATAELQLQFGAIRLLLHAGFVQHLMASRYTTHGMSAVRHQVSCAITC